MASREEKKLPFNFNFNSDSVKRSIVLDAKK